MMKNKKGNFTGWTLMSLMVFGIMVAGAPMVAMAAEVHTVERHPKGGTQTGTVARQGPCVIDLTAPKTTGSCHLKPTDPPAKLIVNKWYTSDVLSKWGGVTQFLPDDKEADSLAKTFLKKEKDNAARFWKAGRLVVLKKTLDTTPGTTNQWNHTANLFSHDELEQAKDSATKWAHMWKNYRGSRFGK